MVKAPHDHQWMTRSRHAVRLFSTDSDLVSRIVDFAHAGVDMGEPTLIVATGIHIAAVRARLSETTSLPRHHPLISFVDADVAVDYILDRKGVSQARLKTVISDALKRLEARAPGKRLRIYGELVNLLWAAGREKEAIELEHWWGKFCVTNRCYLLCGYVIRRVEARYAVGIADIVDAHDVFLPFEQAKGFDESVATELNDVLGSSQAKMVRAMVKADAKLSPLPFGQGALLWMTRHMPTMAARVASAAELSKLS